MSGVKCTSKVVAVILTMFTITGCGSESYAQPFSVSSTAGSPALFAPLFAENLCVTNTDVDADSITMSDSTKACLFDLNQKETLYSLRAHTTTSPASLTKVMTALVAMKYGQSDQMLTASENVQIQEQGAQLAGIKPGSRMTLDQALHLLLIYSANDAAVLIAENIAGSVPEFVELMNQEAAEIGATGCHFVNPHGLTEDDHYVTAYDMYLIFQAALQNDLFQEIISQHSYDTQYTGADGEPVDVSLKATNRYMTGDSTPPIGITVIGGKTGTTQAAGHCLILLARDISGNPYIAVVMNATDTGELYREMNDLLSKIGS